MDVETPSRDTDNVENESVERSNDALAFTINFEDTDDVDEKTKKFERFALRSSLRQLKTTKEDKFGSSPSTVNTFYMHFFTFIMTFCGI